MGCDDIVGWIDWIETRHDRPLEQNPIVFVKLKYEKRDFLVHQPTFWRFLVHQASFHQAQRYGESRAPKFGSFAIVEEVGIEFLSTLTKIILEEGYFRHDMLRLPSAEPAGFDFESEDAKSIREGNEYKYAVFRDGMVLLGNLGLGIPRDIVAWHPINGMRQARNIQG